MKKILIIEDTVLRENTAEFIKGKTSKSLLPRMDRPADLKAFTRPILCDISMPMNGYDFYKTIKQIKSTSTIPLVFFQLELKTKISELGCS
jgi:CheY-like chemotaxis protein